VPLTDPGALHRLAFVVRDVDEAARWFVDMLGAHSVGGMLDGSDPERRREVAESEGADMRLVWLGGAPIVLLGPAGGGGPASRFLERYGQPGVHSLAWEIDDMWALEHRLRERGIGITGVSIEGRHFFMHPRDTHGVLIEWTDGLMGTAPAGGTGAISVSSLAWVTAVVADADATGAFLSEIASVVAAPDKPVGSPDDEHTVDLAIGSTTVRLVSPLTPKSRYTAAIERGPRWASAAFAVDDLDAALRELDAAGIPTIEREGDRAFTDPAATLGLAFEWVS
jgi:catechol 2,3-dioxygenase-like lactoylglutathione lyase family enzyme